jgi:subtilase family serine protease
MDDAGRITTQITAWGDQTTWGGNGTFANNVGSGGGPSTIFAAPAWQAGNTSVNSIVKGMRGQPDISLLADPATGPSMVMDAAFPDAWGYYGGLFPTGGTSLAAPQMAAMWALVLQACKADAICSTKGVSGHAYRMGNPAPLLYAIYGNATQYGATMFDVTYGNNSANPLATPTPAPSTTPGPAPTIMPGFQAGTGYDMVTGIGVPFAGHLINAVLLNQGGASPNLP